MVSHDSAEADLEMSRTGLLKDDVKDEDKVMDGGNEGKKGLRTQILDGACIGLNITSTVTLVFLNKWYACRFRGETGRGTLH